MTTDNTARRQIHLDFHTSRHIEGVGADFDAGEFAATMLAAHVQSVNVFAKCHHGYAYYPSTVGETHPGLSRDLMGEQIEALHSVGIRAPVYVSIMWDDLAAAEHPEWVVHDVTGSPVARAPLGHDSPVLGGRGWSTLDLGSGYAGYVREMVTELCSRYPIDGFWFDIVWPEPNYSPSGLTRAHAGGVADATSVTSMRSWARAQMLAFMAETSALVRRQAPDASVFYNGSVDAEAEVLVPYVTHLEIESLPTSGQWGYLHYPLTSRYARTLGMSTIGMTGRFHRSWSDFGGLKPRAQLAYEVGTVLSGGSAVSIGDQMHPRGKLDSAVYDTIGDVFALAERLDPWLVDSRPRTEIAVLAATTESSRGVHAVRGFTPEVHGAAQVLLEGHHQFDIRDPATADLRDYKLVIVPHELVLDPPLVQRLKDARAEGVALLLSGCTDAANRAELADSIRLPATLAASGGTVPSYVSVGRSSRTFADLDASFPYVVYGGAARLQPAPGAVTWGSIRSAIFQRRWNHFTGHAHAPVGPEDEGPWVAIDAGVAVTAFPLFAAYAEHEFWVYRAMADMVLDHLLPRPALELRGPSWVEATLHTQVGAPGRPARTIVHLNPYTPRRFTTAVARVDDTAAIAGLELTLRLPVPPGAAYRAPDGQQLDLSADEAGTVVVPLPPIDGHTVLIFE